MGITILAIRACTTITVVKDTYNISGSLSIKTCKVIVAITASLAIFAVTFKPINTVFTSDLFYMLVVVHVVVFVVFIL